ncbi:MAG: hypothetical protein FJ087_00100 [Deltaproteobacteria bacterium]|nr:hypothetical protein [Deltaproteobacteria bacterium]
MVETWPHLVFIELLAMLICTVAIGAFSLVVEAPLESIANPGYTPPIAKAPWYFVGLQELLVWFDPWIAGVIVPGVIILGLMAVPYLDREPDHVGLWSPRRRPVAWSIFIFGLALWFGLIAVGTWDRGPHWAWYWPWESWDVEKPPVATTTDLPPWVGIPAVLGYVAGGIALPAVIRPGFRRRLGWPRYLLVTALLLGMLAVPLKIAICLGLDVHYVLVTPWFNL